MADALFGTIERWHAGRAWGHVLDAGTGTHSLQWLCGLATDGWTAVTGDSSRQRRLERELGTRIRGVDQLCTGNWSDPMFLHGEQFETVLADYLLGAVDGFAPYLQSRLFRRLRPHVLDRLYVVGLSPYPDGVVAGDGWDGEAGSMILRIARLRDACILLAGHRCYREYPMSWVVRSLEESGFVVQEATEVPIVYRKAFIHGQLDVCRRKLAYFRDRGLAAAMQDEIERLREQALETCHRLNGLRFGSDYVVAAEPV